MANVNRVMHPYHKMMGELEEAKRKAYESLKKDREKL